MMQIISSEKIGATNIVSDALVTAVHKHKYFFPRIPNSTQLGPATRQENSSAQQGPQDYIDSAHKAARLELQRAGILEGGEILID